jgi:hypothetical protein
MGVLYLLITQAMFMTGNAVLYLCTFPNRMAPFYLLKNLIYILYTPVPTERPTFLREYANGMYGVTAYYLAKSTADLPFQIIYPCIVTTIIYWMVRSLTPSAVCSGCGCG